MGVRIQVVERPVRCPLWVISGQFAMQSACPLYPRKRTCAAATWDVRFVPIADIRRYCSIYERRVSTAFTNRAGELFGAKQLSRVRQEIALKQAIVACKAEAKGKKIRWPASRKFVSTCLSNALKDYHLDVAQLRSELNMAGLRRYTPMETGCMQNVYWRGTVKRVRRLGFSGHCVLPPATNPIQLDLGSP